jgi:predicted NAD/FAD-dependent oxidoreductase
VDATGSCLVIGAGIAGLLAARELTEAGWSVTVLDKGWGVGGRMATRRVGNGTFDHGAQFFTVRGERFGELVEGWIRAGIVEEWSRGFVSADGERAEDGHPRYRCSGGMTGICKHLARDLDVRTGERVVEMNSGSGGSSWEVVCESGARTSARALLITAPAPQALELALSGNVELSEEAREQLANVSYDPCVALMALLSEGPGVVPEPGGVQIKGEPLDWISDNRRKGISDAPALTIHGGPQWSREHYDTSDGALTDALLGFTSERLGTELVGRVMETSVARWRYSWVTEPHPEPYLAASTDPPLLFAGDGFGKQKVEGAALSGLAAADRLLGREG